MSSLRTLSSPLFRRAAAAGGGSAGLYAPLPTQCISRSIFTQSGASSTSLLRSKGAKAGVALALTLPFSLGFSTSSHAAAPNADVESKSSTMLRPKSPAAFRPQPTTLMFASVREDLRKEWDEWIGYFREAGYDCIAVNLDYAAKAGGEASQTSGSDEPHAIFADELGSQIRLSSLQRSPLLFAHYKSSSPSAATVAILHAHLHSRPHISGVIIVAKDNETSEEDRKKLDEMSAKLGGRLLIVGDTEQGIRDGERWMVEKGF